MWTLYFLSIILQIFIFVKIGPDGYFKTHNESNLENLGSIILFFQIIITLILICIYLP